MQLRLVAYALLGTALSFAAAAQSPAHPAGDLCPAGSKYINDDFSPAPAFSEQTRAPRPGASTNFKIQTVLSNVPYGRSMAFMADGRLLLAERSGRLRMIKRDGNPGPAIEGLPVISQSSALIGLMDVALDPDFAHNRTVYLSYVTPKPNAKPAEPGKPPDGIGHIAKARLSKNSDHLEALTVIYAGSRIRRIVAARDGTLYFSTVTGGENAAQSLEQDAGKVLRIKTDGGVPTDNPFVDRKDVGRFVYDLGHRDLDGLAQDGNGSLWSIEHGPRGGDELNLIRAGKNYGFTVIGYGREYSGELINHGLTQQDGMEQPIYFWTPSIAPSGLMIYSGKMWPEWRGNIFLGAMVAQSLVRLTLSNGKVASEEFMLSTRCQRIRDVREAPDGSIYLLTDHADGELLRLSKN